jgi:hypothetical protein
MKTMESKANEKILVDSICGRTNGGDYISNPASDKPCYIVWQPVSLYGADGYLIGGGQTRVCDLAERDGIIVLARNVARENVE